jgi:O-antigen/teichoic acid export membrane protein
MIAQLAVPMRWVPGILHRARSDSLVRNSLYIMMSTGVTAGFGYVFWVIAAHAFTRQEVGIGGAVVSLCSTVALLTYLGPQAVLIERLPASEHSPAWNSILFRMCVATTGVTALVTAAAIPLLLASAEYRIFFNTALPVLLTVAGAAAWTLVNLFNSAFIAARRAGRFLAIQTLVSAAKVLFIIPLAAAGAGSVGVFGAWVASAVVGVAAGISWLIPGMGLGRRSGRRSRRHETAAVPKTAAEPGKHPAPRHKGSHRQRSAGLSGPYARRLLGQHMTSLGGAMTPLVMPVLVVVRLGTTLNAYFYITWMIGAIFFTVSPSVATALFAEGVRQRSDLRRVVVKALRVISVILVPAMLVMIVGGRFVLGLFGAPYAAAGYGLLVLLAISALPDAVSNVAVAVLRVTHRLGYSSALNIGIFVVSLVAAWLLMPALGIVGVGVAWLGVQTLGAIACLPAFGRARKAANA